MATMFNGFMPGKYKAEALTQPSRITSGIGDFFGALAVRLLEPRRTAPAAPRPGDPRFIGPVQPRAQEIPVIRISGTGRSAPDWTGWIIPGGLALVAVSLLLSRRR